MEKELIEKVLQKLIRLKQILKSCETFDFNNPHDYSEGIEVEDLINEIKSKL